MNEGFLTRGHGSQNDEAETPAWLYRALNAEWGFTFDGAASEKNHKCKLWTADIAEAVISHRIVGQRIFVNPPYSNIDLFVTYALAVPGLWVLLLPAFVDKTWYRLLWESRRVEWRPFRERIVFEIDGRPIASKKTGKPQSPFFGSTLAIVRPRDYILTSHADANHHLSNPTLSGSEEH